MNRYGLLVALAVSLLCGGAAYAGDESFEKEIHAGEWQKQSLKGVASIRFLAISRDTPVDKEVSRGLSGIGVPCMQESLTGLHKGVKLADNEALVKVIAKSDNKGKCWVGVSVEQKALLSRTPSLSFESETYKVGRICAPADVSNAVKDVCAEFVENFKAENGKDK